MISVMINWFKNRKAHADPLCLAFPIVATALGIVFLMMVKRPSRLSAFESYLLFGFALAVMLSVVMRTMKHGLGGLSAILAFTLVILCMLLLRFVVGQGDPSHEFLSRNLRAFISILIVGGWLQQFLP